MEFTKSQRIVHALRQLDQFSLAVLAETDQAIHVLSGVVVSPRFDPDDKESDLIKLKFPGGLECDVTGSAYLNLQILESAAHALHGARESDAPIAKRARELSDYLCKKYRIN